MALKIWLPLTGDLENKGISNATVENFGATVDNAGKIGSCYSFDGSSQYLKINNFNISNWPQMTITFWSDNGPIKAFTLKQAATMQFRSTANNNFYFRDTQHSSETKVTINTVISENTWAHYAFVYNEGNWNVYVNGIQAGQFIANTSATLNSNIQTLWICNASTTSSQIFKTGKINDFRIYDNALSAAEVHEIAQGLILHYKLDILTSNKICDSSGYNHNGEIVNTLTTSSNTPKYQNSTYFSNSSYIKYPNFNFPTNIWTISCWYYRDTNPSAYEAIFCLSKGNGSDANKKIAAIPNAGYIWFKGESGSLSISKLNISSWTMLTMVCDGTLVKIYENTIKIGEFNAGNQMLDCTDLVIGARSASTGINSISVPYTGQISDFRIYCTPLLDNDIKILYNIGMRVDNLGGVHTNNLEEKSENLFRTELIQPWAKNTNDGHGEIILRNGVPAIRINPAPFWHNIDANTSGWLIGAFKSNTSYIFDIWMDNEEALNSTGTSGTASGFYIYFSDGTSNSTFVKTGGVAGWQHFYFITPENKTITKLHVQYSTNTPVYYRYDSYICEADKTSINLSNTQTPQLKENHTSASIANKGAIYSTNFIEM